MREFPSVHTSRKRFTGKYKTGCETDIADKCCRSVMDGRPTVTPGGFRHSRSFLYAYFLLPNEKERDIICISTKKGDCSVG